MELKPAKTFKEQVILLKERGCIINDEDECENFLSKNNYYRISAYFLPFRNDDDSYKEGTSITRIKKICEFDRKIRKLIFTIVEEIEIFIKTKLAYYHAHKYGPHGYWDDKNFNVSHQHDHFIKQIESEIIRNKNTLWVKHHNNKYDGKFPIWVIIESFSLGMLSRFYADMFLEDRKKIASEINTKDLYLKSWLRSLTVLRNICAHYGRLYGVMFTNIPKFPPALSLKPTGKLYDQLFTLKWLSPDKAIWDTNYFSELHTLIHDYSEDIVFDHIGLSNKWENDLKSLI